MKYGTDKDIDTVLTKIIKDLEDSNVGEESYTIAGLINLVQENLGKQFKKHSTERTELKEAIVKFMNERNEEDESSEDDVVEDSEVEVEEVVEEVEKSDTEGEGGLPLKGTYCVNYTAKSLLILGDTKEVVSVLKSVGDGRYIPGVKGWIFKIAQEENLGKLGCKRQLNKLPDGSSTNLPYKDVLEKYPIPAKERFKVDLTSLLAKYDQTVRSDSTVDKLLELVTELLG